MVIDIKEDYAKAAQAWYRCRACGRVFPSGYVYEFKKLLDALSDLALARDERIITHHQVHACDDGGVGLGDLIAVKPMGVRASWQ